MSVRIFNHLSIISVAACILAGCATTQNAEPKTTITSAAVPATQTTTEPATTQTAVPHLQISDFQPIANRVEWPAAPAPETTVPTSNIQSGVADNVWVEGKGFFRGTLQDVYNDLTDVMVIGPTHMTQNIERDEFVQTDALTSYVMHVKMKYILSVEFDLTAKLEPVFDGETQVGWFYQSDKTAGTRFIQMISDSIIIRQIENGWFSVEMRSLNQATQDKEKEARAHVETLFSYWQEASAARAPSPAAVPETNTDSAE
ncbi:MAG: hypothetical protein IJM59_09415 [Proteobacteria bacterium]|nr:hypothetical protein [Pseudomonadota bacterium]